MFLNDVSYTEFLRLRNPYLKPVLKCYGDNLYKLVINKVDVDFSSRGYVEKGGADNELKLNNNLIRAKNRVLELALCNNFDFFVTLTIDKTKYDRYNLNKYIQDLSKFIRNQNRKEGFDIKYLLVPEQHKDGAWHLHGFIKGLPAAEITPNGNKDENGEPYMHWERYYRKFGFMSMSPVRDVVKASFYIKKYITKTLLESNMSLGAHTYYASQGLEGASDSIPLDEQCLYDKDFPAFRFVHDFCDVAYLDKEIGQSFLEKYGLQK